MKEGLQFPYSWQDPMKFYNLFVRIGNVAKSGTIRIFSKSVSISKSSELIPNPTCQETLTVYGMHKVMSDAHMSCMVWNGLDGILLVINGTWVLVHSVQIVQMSIVCTAIWSDIPTSPQVVGMEGCLFDMNKRQEREREAYHDNKWMEGYETWRGKRRKWREEDEREKRSRLVRSSEAIIMVIGVTFSCSK